MKTLGSLFNFRRTEDAKNITVLVSHYQCPMRCEGEKTYDAPGNCPVCNMKLVPVGSEGSKHHSTEHYGHSHHGCC